MSSYGGTGESTQDASSSTWSYLSIAGDSEDLVFSAASGMTRLGIWLNPEQPKNWLGVVVKTRKLITDSEAKMISSDCRVEAAAYATAEAAILGIKKTLNM